MKQTPTGIVLGVWLLLVAGPAYAYRPFNSTDAAVAARGEMEIECGPFGYIVEVDGRFVVIPSVILNVGVAEGWEVVIEGRNFVTTRSDVAKRRDTVRETALSVKGIVRQGSLQDRTGPSVGLEASLLLPGIGTDPGIGASILGIVSQRWSALTVHANGALLIPHEHTLGGIASAIVECPSRWPIRPVAAWVLEHNGGRTVCGLGGGLWHVRQKWSIGGGCRRARAG